MSETFEPPTSEPMIGEAVVNAVIHLPSGCVNDGIETQVFYPLNSLGLYMKAPIVCGYCHCELKIKGVRNVVTSNGAVVEEVIKQEQQNQTD